SGVRLPFALSLAGHAVLLAALTLLVVTPPRPAPPALRSIELILAPPTPKPPPAPVARPAPPKPPAIHPPPRPAPAPKPKTVPAPVRAPLPSVAVPPPRPQHKPIIRRIERPPPRRIRREPVRPRTIPPPRYAPPRYVPPPPQYYAPPPRRAPPAAATISPGYRARLIGWIGAHTYYPQSARDAGEEGEVLLRFRIERSGRVADVAVVRSSGYPDLDAAALAMMRGAALPPFPPSMPQQSITVEVPIRFRLG
ncbi:MAG: energy transducer TonB, partial [Stellaceae bacterium]